MKLTLPVGEGVVDGISEETEWAISAAQVCYTSQYVATA